MGTDTYGIQASMEEIREIQNNYFDDASKSRLFSSSLNEE